MHEMSITQGIVEICQQNCGGRRVKGVTLQVGELSGVIPEALEFCFEACVKDTELEGAKLIVERVEARGRCPDCGVESRIKAYYDPCPSCGKYGVQLLSGEELRVKELEVE